MKREGLGWSRHVLTRSRHRQVPLVERDVERGELGGAGDEAVNSSQERHKVRPQKH